MRGGKGRRGEGREKVMSPPPVFGGSLRLWPLTTLSTIVVVTWNVRSELFNQKIEKSDKRATVRDVCVSNF